MKPLRLPTGSPGYWRVWVATLLFFAAFYTLMIPLPLYLSGVGLPDWQVSLVLGALGITSLVVRPVAGVLADSWGRRAVMLVSTGALVVGTLGVSWTTHPTVLFILRALQAAGYAGFTTASTALIADLVPAENRTSALAVFGIAANVAMTLVPAGVSALLDGGWLPLRGAFWLAGGLALVAGALVIGAIKDPQKHGGRESGSLVQDLIPLIKTLALPAGIAALFGIGFGTFFQFLPLLAERRGLGPVGLAYTVYGIIIILTRLVAGKKLDRARSGWVLAFGLLILAGGLVAFALAGNRWHLLLGAALVAAGSGVLHPMLIAIHIRQVDASARGRASAVFYLGFDLGIGLGTWIAAPVFENYGLAGLYLMGALVALVGLLPAWFYATNPLADQPRAGQSH